MDRMMEGLRRRSNALHQVIDVLDKFNGVELNDKTRKELKDCLKGITVLKRVDVDKTITLRETENSEELIIIYPIENKIMIFSDILWKVIFSLEERISEMRAYESELN